MACILRYYCYNQQGQEMLKQVQHDVNKKAYHNS